MSLVLIERVAVGKFSQFAFVIAFYLYFLFLLFLFLYFIIFFSFIAKNVGSDMKMEKFS